MRIKNIETKVTWSIKLPLLALGIYFLFILPSKQIFFWNYPWLYKNIDTLFITIVALFLLIKFNYKELGFSTKYLNQHLVIGLIAGLLLLLGIPLLDYVLDLLNLSEHRLFIEQNQNKTQLNGSIILKNISFILVMSLLEQIFFTGFILQSLLKRINSILALYVVGLIYTLFGFNLTLGKFILAMIASLLFTLTGTLYASILFQMSCLTGWELVENIYPRLIVIFAFLF